MTGNKKSKSAKPNNKSGSKRKKENCENTANKSNLTNILQDLSKREFAKGYHYRLKHLKSMIPIANSVYLPKFWDDSTITTEEHQSIEWMAGVEVHLHKTLFALYGRNKYDHRQKYLGPILIMNNNPRGFIEFYKELDTYQLFVSRFLMETTGVYHFPVAWQLQDLYPNSEIIAMDAKSIHKFLSDGQKSDTHDAVKLAQLAHLDDFIKPSHIPTKELMGLRELVRQLEKTKREHVRLKNAIKKILASGGFSYIFNYKNEWEIELILTFLNSALSFGEAVQMHKDETNIRRNKDKFKNWLHFNLPELFKANVLLLFGLLKQSELNLKMIEATIMNTVDNFPDLQEKYTLFKDCSGLGIFSIIAIILESGDMDRFKSVAHYLSYCGIGPCSGTSGYVDESSDKEKVVSSPSPNKHSNHTLKRIFISAAGSILKSARKKSSESIQLDDMFRYSERYIVDNRKKMKLKFKIAAKLIRRVYYCLKTNQKYDPFIEYKRSPDMEKDKVSEVENRMSKRKRQAWTYKQVNLLKYEIEDFLDEISKQFEHDSEFHIIQEHFKSFMEKLKVPSRHNSRNTEVII